MSKKVVARAGITIERLVEAGAKLADEAGFEAATPSALAALFDVKVASLYSHIANAHELKTRIALFALDNLANRTADALAGLAGRDALIAFAAAHRDFAREHPGQFAATRFPLEAAAAASSGGARLSRLTRAVLHGYGLGEPAQTHAVRFIGSTLLGFITLESAGGFAHSQPDPEASWRAMLDALDATFRQWPRAKSGRA